MGPDADASLEGTDLPAASRRPGNRHGLSPGAAPAERRAVVPRRGLTNPPPDAGLARRAGPVPDRPAAAPDGLDPVGLAGSGRDVGRGGPRAAPAPHEALPAADGRLQLRHLDRHGRADYLGRGAAPPGEAGHRARPPISSRGRGAPCAHFPGSAVSTSVVASDRADDRGIVVGKIVLSENVSLDGVGQDPTGDEGLRNGGWFNRVGDFDRAEWAKVLFDEALRAEALLLGRRSDEWFATRWLSRSGPWADRLNSMPKYVVSSTLDEPRWGNATVLAGDVVNEVSKLKQR